MAGLLDMEAPPPPSAPARRIICKPVNDGDWLKRDLPKLHKDFYLKHPDPSLQNERFCFGNLEEAHPVLGKRSLEDAEEYRKSKGIMVQAVRGRAAPKPFQTFQETSFPPFVEELAMELFSTENSNALPFPIQAQAWPCALAGFDVIAVAPTGSGKTLGFLLPALVHIMAQPQLQPGEGPIALVLEPTRELAVQTHEVAQQFCDRTSGEDRLRAGVIFGGVAAQQQTPMEAAPDFGRWPEVLVATPGRLLELISMKRWISAKRISYVVLDEADHMLSTGTWLIHIKELLKLMRPDRQMLMFSATWPQDAEKAASDLCGEELMKIRVNPAVPSIPQEVKLFFGSYDGAHDKKMAELVRWIKEELRPDESILLFLHNPRFVQQIVGHRGLREALGTGGIAVLDHSQPHEEQRAQYLSFVRGKAKMLVSTFSLAGRGLDFHDADGTALSLAVFLFDFPNSIGDYANCIGRTARPGQRGGRVVAFLPEGRFWIAGELIALLEHCGQKVPEALEKLYKQDQEFLSQMKAGMLQLLNDGDLAADELCGGHYDKEKKIWSLPRGIPSYRRKLVHLLGDELGVPHVSHGDGAERKLYISKDRDVLPDKYFVEGEAVVILHHLRGQQTGTVADAHVNWRQRTIQIYISNPAFGEHPVDVPVEIVWPEGKQPAEVPGQLARYPAERLRYERDFYNRGYRSDRDQRPWKTTGGYAAQNRGGYSNGSNGGYGERGERGERVERGERRDAWSNYRKQ